MSGGSDRVCLFSFEGVGAGGGTGVKLQKMNRKRKVVGDEGKGHPPKSSALPRKAEGRDGRSRTRGGKAEGSSHFSGIPQPLPSPGLGGCGQNRWGPGSRSPALSSRGAGVSHLGSERGRGCDPSFPDLPCEVRAPARGGGGAGLRGGSWCGPSPGAAPSTPPPGGFRSASLARSPWSHS